jgi:hypothetical protein
MIIVRDFSTQQQKWVYWKTSDTKDAYLDYPTNSGLPPISSLLGSLQVIKVVSDSQSTSSVPESTIWTVDGLDIYANYLVDGHTGVWSLVFPNNAILSNRVYPTKGNNNITVFDTIKSSDGPSFAVDSDGNIVFDPTLEEDTDNVILLDLGNDEISILLYSDMVESGLAKTEIDLEKLAKPVDIAPGSTSMPDKYWKLSVFNDEYDIIPK